MSRTRGATLAGAVLAALALPLLLPAVASAQPVCDDLLVTHRPDGSSGDLDAVVITSQALDRTVDGWAMVGWEVATDTDLRQVVVVDASGERELPPTARVADGGVVELRFCGTSRAGAGAAPHAVDTDEHRDPAAAVGRGASTPTGAVGYAAGFVPEQFAVRRRADGGTVPLSILGATLGAAVGGVVLLLSRGARGEVAR